MKICQICKQEIKIGQSWKGTGAGYVHIFCLVGKKVKPAMHVTKSRRTGGE